jgi:hypothetical protein
MSARQTVELALFVLVEAHAAEGFDRLRTRGGCEQNLLVEFGWVVLVCGGVKRVRNTMDDGVYRDARPTIWRRDGSRCQWASRQAGGRPERYELICYGVRRPIRR